MRETVIKGWGYELWIENNDLYCGKHLHVLPDKKCSVHYHKNKKETFYVINGELKLTYIDSIQDMTSKRIEDLRVYWTIIVEQKEIILKKGESFTIEPYVPHVFTSNTAYPCDFIEFSTQHKESDSYRIIKGD